MARQITTAEGHFEGEKTDHRSGKKTPTKQKVDIIPQIDGYVNKTLPEKHRFNRPFFTMFTDTLQDLIVNGNLSLREWKVYLYLCSELWQRNVIVTTLATLCEALGLDKPAICTTLNKLKKKNLILTQFIEELSWGRGSKPMAVKLNGAECPVMNARVVWNGPIKDYSVAKSKCPELTKEDGKTYLNPTAELRRLKKLAEIEAAAKLFPEESLFQDYDLETGEYLGGSEKLNEGLTKDPDNDFSEQANTFYDKEIDDSEYRP